jgi:competence protein ComEC
LAILDVGHGNATVLYSDERAIIVDAGPGTALLEFLRQQQITTIVAVLISHADADHLKGLGLLLKQSWLSVQEVRLNSDALKESELWDAMLSDLDKRQRESELEFEVSLVEGDMFELDTTSMVEVLAPRRYLAGKGPGNRDSSGRKLSSNSVSAIVRVESPPHTTLLAGDVDGVGLAHVEETAADLSADILVFPHHGGHVSTRSSEIENRDFADRLLRLVNPAFVAFSTGRRGHRNPRPEIVAAAVDHQAVEHIMCTQMSRDCSSSERLSEAGHLATAYAAGKHEQRCCAGTVLLGPQGIVPNRDEHVAFIERFAPSALCRPGVTT